MLGSLLASGFYKLIKSLEYETANPGQDFDENETKLFDPERDVDRPMVNFVAPGSSEGPPGPSRPISGDTIAAYRREEIPLEQARSYTSSGHGQVSAMKGGRRGSSPLQPAGLEAEKSAPLGDDGGPSNGEDIVHGGAHYSQTANQLDPNLHNDMPIKETYQGGPDAEAGRQVVRDVGPS